MEEILFSVTMSDLSDAAREHVRPSGLDRVSYLKTIAVLFITECEKIRDEGKAAREASVAITEMQTASMWAVSAATKSL